MTFLWPDMLWLLLLVPGLVAGYVACCAGRRSSRSRTPA